MKASRVSRIFRIMTALQSAQRYTVDDLAKMLGVSQRTVFRDLKDLQKAGVPCHYVKKSRYYAIDTEFFLPAPDLNPHEALGLLLLTCKARNHIHLPFKNSALTAALKIENNLSSKIKQYCNTALQTISIKADPQERLDLLDKIFTQLLKAILEKQVVSIRYYLPCEPKSIVTNLNPYHLMYNGHTWYVIGKSALHKGICTFKLNQIKKLNTLDKCFIKDEKFDVHEHLGRAWSVTPEGRLYNIKLRFLPEVAHSVGEVQWHSTQTVTFENNGSAIVEFRVDGLNEISWWILGYGDQVQVLAPAVLRQKIIKIARGMVRQNKRLLLT
ncbi:MAG: helix-turn-helix transcriptional regulator [Planctomycetota bacterium]